MANPMANSRDNSQLTNYINNLGYENYIWKTKYNELWTNYLAAMAENKRLQDEINELKTKLQNQTQLQSVEQMLQNDAASGNRNPLVEYLQKKNAELIEIIMKKDALIADFQRNIPNSPPPFPKPPEVNPLLK
jgi:predicted  nucleic acid-binding Zn-ribbon protein